MSYVEHCEKHGQYHADYICFDCVEDLKEENAKLRTALEKIEYPGEKSVLTYDYVVKIAREALK